MAREATESDRTSLEDELTGALQENVLTLLCYSEKAAATIRRLVEPALFENLTYRRIAERASNYIDEFGAPAGDHIADEVGDLIASSLPRRADTYRRTLTLMHDTHEGINEEYVLSRLTAFIRSQQLKRTVITAMKALQAGRVADTEMILQDALNDRIEPFDPGLLFWKPDQALRFFDTQDNALPLNIKPLDAARVGPAPQELFTFIAPTGKGKTWFLLHVAKQAVKLRKKTVFVSLEMSSERLRQRFVQAYFSYGKRKLRDAAGNHVTLQGIKRRKRERPTLDDENTQTTLANFIHESGRRIPLIIKQFPPASLTMSGLQAYLDSLAQLHHFQPEVLIVDYADLMQHDTNNLRIDLEHTYQQLRGLAIERNLAVVTASQANRLGGQDDTKLVTLAHVAESIGKVNVADNVVTYTQSRREQPYGLARLFVAKARNDVSHFTVAITQAYHLGQFCLDAIRMPGERYGEDVE